MLPEPKALNPCTLTNNTTITHFVSKQNLKSEWVPAIPCVNLQLLSNDELERARTSTGVLYIRFNKIECSPAKVTIDYESVWEKQNFMASRGEIVEYSHTGDGWHRKLVGFHSSIT